MEFRTCSIFEAGYDGNFTQAQRIIQIYQGSHGFTLTSYSGQDDFYRDYLNKYDRYVNIVGPSIRFSTLRSVLLQLADQGYLSLAHFLLAFIQVFRESDRQKDIPLPQIFPRLKAKIYDDYTSFEEIYLDMIEYQQIFPRMVPFISRTAAFGLNTFFLLYFSGLYPAGCSLDPYPVHNGAYPGSVATLAHDYQHLDELIRIDADREYFDQLKQLYLKILNSGLPDGQIKGMIVVLFIQTHELGLPFNCQTKMVRNQTDEYELISQNTYYTSEMIGPTNDIINAFIYLVQHDICQILCS